MPLLNSLNTPSDLRKLPLHTLPELCVELRAFVQNKTHTKANHIKSSLGVTELTIALHYTYNTPTDILVWDVGHQAYVHKLLTGRKDTFSTNRQFKGISGFTSRLESAYDPFGAGHSSTALSATAGFAQAAKLQGVQRQHIAVVGDGAFTGGMHFEAMNYAGEQKLNLTLVINDNQSSIDANVGAVQKLNSYKQLCESFGFTFLGEVDGHNTTALHKAFAQAKHLPGCKAIVVHTQKGKGYIEKPVAQAQENPITFQKTVGETLVHLAQRNKKLVVVSPAMLSGAGLHPFKVKFPNRCFDVGIAEQHAVTMSAALAAEGYHVFCHLYSTFAQRAYDQIIHDVALQNLPVTFLVDRAGLVGEDGATHHGAFDLSFLNAIPNLHICAPADVISLKNILIYASTNKSSPLIIRYPKGSAASLHSTAPNFGKGRWIHTTGKKLLISIGALQESQKTAIAASGVAHYDWFTLKPFNTNLALEIVAAFKEIITLEEGSAAGGLGQAFASLFSQEKLHKSLTCLSLPDSFVPHGNDEDLLAFSGLDAHQLLRVLQH